MDLRLGCREQLDGKWIYYLRDGSSLTKQEWIKLVEQQIKKQGHEDIFENIEKTVRLWNEGETVHEVALQVYASKYCSDVERITSTNSVELKIVKDNMGCDQLSF